MGAGSVNRQLIGFRRSPPPPSLPRRGRCKSSSCELAGAGSVMHLEHQRPVRFVKSRRHPHRHPAHCVAVVALFDRDELCFFRPPQVPPVLHRHLERDFGRRRAAVAVEDFRQPRRGDADQLLRQYCRRLAGQAEQGGVGDFVELRADGRIDLRHTMAVDVAPQAARSVEVTPAVAVKDVHAFAMGDHHRIVGPATGSCG